MGWETCDAFHYHVNLNVGSYVTMYRLLAMWDLLMAQGKVEERF